MLEYKINSRNFNKTSNYIPVNRVTYVDMEEIQQDLSYYEIFDNDKIMVLCECNNVDYLNDGDFITTTNNLVLTFFVQDAPVQQVYTFTNNYQIAGLNRYEKSFSFYIDKYIKLDVQRLISGYDYFIPHEFFEGHDNDNIFLHCKSFHYFDSSDDVDETITDAYNYYQWNETIDFYDLITIAVYDGETLPTEDNGDFIMFNSIVYKWDNENNVYNEIEFNETDSVPYEKEEDYIKVRQTINEQKIPIYLRYKDQDGNFKSETVFFRFYDYSTLTCSLNDFSDELYKDIFGVDKSVEQDGITYYITCPPMPTEETAYGWKMVRINHLGYYYYTWEEKKYEGDIYPSEELQPIYASLAGLEIYRNTFLFGDKVDYSFIFEQPSVYVNVPLSNTFETNLFQTELLNKNFIEKEKNKVINTIVDIEKDVYYPCIAYIQDKRLKFQDIYTIKFNLHFREHRGDSWIVDNDCFWNGVEHDSNNKAVINDNITTDNASDLLCFLNYNNDDVHYQKNRLKKSFLRLSYYDSTNPGNQNMIGYSTIFFNTNTLFSKYIRNINLNEYANVKFTSQFGEYEVTGGKGGIRVNREHYVDGNSDFDEEKRLSSQLVVSSKNTSSSSSDGFYMYIWKDNESAMPQDLYMKVEFNHAGYGRTIPFMMPFWDERKYINNNKVVRRKSKGIKTFEEILDDWNSVRVYREVNNPLNYKTTSQYANLTKDQQGKYYPDWQSGNYGTDGHYGIQQYNKYSYIHLKYQYDKDSDKHYYYIDPETYGESGTNPNNEIIINLYEAKIE